MAIIKRPVILWKGEKKMLYMVIYHTYTDFFTASSYAEAVEKARVLSCGGSFVLSVVQ